MLTLVVEEETPLYDWVHAGTFQLLTQAQVLEETRLLLERLEVDPLHFTSDHASNYLPLKGGLPGDKARLLALLDGALSGEQGIKPELCGGCDTKRGVLRWTDNTCIFCGPTPIRWSLTRWF